MTTLRMTARNLTIISLLALLAVTSAHGQGATVLRASVPFAFEAHGTPFAAGAYQFKVRLDDRSLVIGGTGVADVKLQIITQISGFSVFRDAGLVFDSFEGKHVLSEYGFPAKTECWSTPRRNSTPSTG